MSEEALLENEENTDILDMDDSEVDDYIAKLEAAEENPTEEPTDTVEEEEDEDDADDEEEVQEERVEEGDSQEDVDDEEDDEESDDDDDSEEPQSTEDAFKDSKETDDITDNKAEESKIDYKAEYEKLTAPFKANGKEMQIQDVDEARTLMQMGTNYIKKMTALKPNLKIVKMLEKNDLLDEDRINFLIDLSKKDPDAISKLLKDSGVDPLDIDTEQADKYQPNSYQLNDKEVELDEILDEIRDTSAFQTTASIIGNKWDEKSKQVLVDNPLLIKVINEHVESGIYDQISNVVERERMLGKLVGLSDIEAYKFVGDAINAQGGFNNQSQSTSSNTANTEAKKVDRSNKRRKKAASSTRGKKSSTQIDDDFNPLSMSDEEFEKIASSKFV